MGLSSESAIACLNAYLFLAFTLNFREMVDLMYHTGTCIEVNVKDNETPRECEYMIRDIRQSESFYNSFRYYVLYLPFVYVMKSCVFIVVKAMSLYDLCHKTQLFIFKL
jgi:hypothetical protein